MQRGELPSYDAALVCGHGDLINFSFHRRPQHNTPFCWKCGAPTRHTCPSCKAEIRGKYESEGPLFSADEPEIVSPFCRECGEPYPRTAGALAAAHEYALEIDGLDERDREQLVGTLDDLVLDSPVGMLAGSRFKRLVTRAGGTAGPMMRELVVSIASDAAKKAMGL